MLVRVRRSAALGRALSLVAIYDLGGIGEGNDLAILDKEPEGFAIYEYEGGRQKDSEVKNLIKDLDGNARLELVIQSHSMRAGRDNMPFIYAWTGAEYANVSSRILSIIALG
jgi:hypothetical protein